MNALTPPLIDSHGRSYRLLRARDVLPGDEILFDMFRAQFRVEEVDIDALGQPRLRYGHDTASTGFLPTDWLRVAEAAARSTLCLRGP